MYQHPYFIGCNLSVVIYPFVCSSAFIPCKFTPCSGSFKKRIHESAKSYPLQNLLPDHLGNSIQCEQHRPGKW